MNLMNKPVAIWDGQFHTPTTKLHRISICVTCMGRLEDLSQTILQNIDDNADYPNLEFVILDYNSNDGLAHWVQDTLATELSTGRVAYYRTSEPKHYSMAHSRNVAFRLAQGEIVNNVDADNWTNAGFATYLNRLANECPQKAIFAKGKRLLHGRIGFFKDEWLSLGGYDESLQGYGHDDKDLLHRALLTGFTLMWYGGQFVKRIKTPRQKKAANMQIKSLRVTEELNKTASDNNLRQGKCIANQGCNWGNATVTKNFSEVIKVGEWS